MIERLKNQTINLGLLGDLCLLPLLRINNRNRARQVQIDALEKRIVELEARPVSGVQYGGIYDDKKAYTSGQLVTRSGGLWLALSGSTGERPGTSPAWKLIVKSGSDRPVGDTR